MLEKARKKRTGEGRGGGKKEEREINDQLLQKKKILNSTGYFPKSKLRYHLSFVRLTNVNNSDNTICW